MRRLSPLDGGADPEADTPKELYAQCERAWGRVNEIQLELEHSRAEYIKQEETLTVWAKILGSGY